MNMAHIIDIPTRLGTEIPFH